MKFANALAIICSSLLLQVALLPNAVAAEQGAPAKTPEAAYQCESNKAKVTTCKRSVSADAKKQCRWKCRTECGGQGAGRQCTENCRGSGQECNGKSPPGW